MSPSQSKHTLYRLIQHRLSTAVMIWGPPGIGKSMIVADLAQENGLAFIDLRLSQLAPTDLRGLPVPRDGKAAWLPPEFLPDSGSGILFLDEINLAPPAMQGIAQQLILDRRVGSYQVPDGWFIWAAGNRTEDRASVYEMPAPLANRFLHFCVEPDFDSFRDWAVRHNIDDRIIAFLAFRPQLMHHQSDHTTAWPSPRSWAMADPLLKHGIDLDVAVGPGAASEFNAFIRTCTKLPDLDAIFNGDGKAPRFPKEPSLGYALTLALAVRWSNVPAFGNALKWMTANCAMEWLRLFLLAALERARRDSLIGSIVPLIIAQPKLREFKEKYAQYLAS